MVIEPDALHLRLRGDAELFTPPDVEAFLRGPASAGPHVEEELGVLPGDRAVAPDGPLVVFLQQPEFGIPAPNVEPGLPDLDSWSVRPTTFGWVASVAPSTRGAGPRRAAQVLAGCLALSLPIPALAVVDAPATPAAGSSAPAATTAAPVPAKTTAAPATAAPATAAPATAAPPTTAPATTAPPTTAPPAVAEAAPTTTATTSAPEWTPPAVTPPPRVKDTAAVANAAWEGVDGFAVVIELKGGKVLRGRIGAVQAETFTLIDGTDGQILVIPKSGVASLRAHVPPPIPTQTGSGLLASGSVLLSLGVPVFITGIAFVAICPSCVYLHLPMLIVGGGAVGGGIPMISRGIQRRTAFQRALNEHRVAPMVSRTLYNGWTGGIQFRF